MGGSSGALGSSGSGARGEDRSGVGEPTSRWTRAGAESVTSGRGVLRGVRAACACALSSRGSLRRFRSPRRRACAPVDAGRARDPGAPRRRRAPRSWRAGRGPRTASESGRSARRATARGGSGPRGARTGLSARAGPRRLPALRRRRTTPPSPTRSLARSRRRRFPDPPAGSAPPQAGRRRRRRNPGPAPRGVAYSSSCSALATMLSKPQRKLTRSTLSTIRSPASVKRPWFGKQTFPPPLAR